MTVRRLAGDEDRKAARRENNVLLWFQNMLYRFHPSAIGRIHHVTTTNGGLERRLGGSGSSWMEAIVETI